MRRLLEPFPNEQPAEFSVKADARLPDLGLVAEVYVDTKDGMGIRVRRSRPSRRKAKPILQRSM